MADHHRDRFDCLMTPPEISLEAVASVSRLAAADWDACANPPAAPIAPDGSMNEPASGPCTGLHSAYNPFVSHAFFAALEASGSASPRTGWAPRHLVARLGGGIAGI